MRAFVFTDRSLARQAGRFVWLAIDTEKPGSAPFRVRFPVEALPTFLVVDPADEKVALRWVGGATPASLRELLDDGAIAVERRNRGAAEPLARADGLYGEGNNAAAAAAYEAALARSPADWPQRARTVESLLFALQRTGENERCAGLARRALPGLRRTTSAANVAASGLDCALALPAENRLRKELIESLEAEGRKIATDSSLEIAADDRSGLYGTLVSAREDAGDEAGKRTAASDWAAFLEREAARAATPEQRAVFDSHRLSAYLELGAPERALPMLEASERDLPGDYNPPARLALAYKALKRWDEALAASDRALSRAYGPRRLSILQNRAEVYAGRGDSAAARGTLEQALHAAEALPPGQRSESAIASIRKKLDAMR